MNSEPKEIAEARESLKIFERSEGLTGKHLFEEGITLLKEFRIDNPDPIFSNTASNLIDAYTKCLVRKLDPITTPFLKLIDWFEAYLWVQDYKTEIDKIIVNNLDLKDIYNKFTKHNPWKDELAKILKEHKEDFL